MVVTSRRGFKCLASWSPHRTVLPRDSPPRVAGSVPAIRQLPREAGGSQTHALRGPRYADRAPAFPPGGPVLVLGCDPDHYLSRMGRPGFRERPEALAPRAVLRAQVYVLPRVGDARWPLQKRYPPPRGAPYLNHRRPPAASLTVYQRFNVVSALAPCRSRRTPSDKDDTPPVRGLLRPTRCRTRYPPRARDMAILWPSTTSRGQT
jgi:hypothetical protein